MGLTTVVVQDRPIEALVVEGETDVPPLIDVIAEDVEREWNVCLLGADPVLIAVLISVSCKALAASSSLATVIGTPGSLRDLLAIAGVVGGF